MWTLVSVCQALHCSKHCFKLLGFLFSVLHDVREGDSVIWSSQIQRLSGVDMKRVILKGFFQMVDEQRGVTKTLCKIKKDYF